MLPFPILNYYGNNIVPPVKTIERFSISSNGSGVLLHYANGDLYALGTNTAGKFGTGDTTNITGAWRLIASNVRKYVCSHNFTIIIYNDGSVQYSGNVSGIFTSALGYSFSATTVFTDMSSAFSTFDITGIKSLESIEDSGTRMWLIDKNDALWCIGSNQYYALGSSSSLATTNWVQAVNGTNVERVMPGLQSVWIKKKDNTYWRAGTNAYGLLMSSSASQTYTTFTVQNSYAGTAANNTIRNLTVTPYNMYMNLEDGSVRIYGVRNSGQTGTGSTTGTALIPDNPSGTSGVMKLLDSTGSFYSSYLVGPNGLLVAGQGTNNMFGLGTGASPTTFTLSNTGVMTNLDYANLDYLNFVTSNAGYAVIGGEVYTAGNSAYTLGATSYITWTLMNTPQSQLWGTSGMVSTITNASTTSPTMTRYSHSRCSYGDNKFIIYGGYNGTTIFNDINIYDGTTGTWSTVPVTGTTKALFGAGITTIGDTMYVFCGNSTTSTTTNTIYSVNLLTGDWTTITPSGSTISARSHVRACTIDSIIYIWGGESVNTWFSFNPVTNVVAAMPTSPVTSSIDADMVTDGKDIFVNIGTAAFYKYSTSKAAWIVLANKNNAALKLAYSNGYIYGSMAGNTFLFAYKVSTNIWTQLPNPSLISTSRHCLASAAGKVVYTGGIASTNTNNCFTIT